MKIGDNLFKGGQFLAGNKVDYTKMEQAMLEYENEYLATLSNI